MTHEERQAYAALAYSITPQGQHRCFDCMMWYPMFWPHPLSVLETFACPKCNYEVWLDWLKHGSGQSREFRKLVFALTFESIRHTRKGVNN